MFLTREMVESLVNDPEQFRIVNETDHAEWFAGLKDERTFEFSLDVWSNTPGLVFETDKGLFATSPEGKAFKVNLGVEVGLKNEAMRVALTNDGFRAVKRADDGVDVTVR